MNEKKKKKNHYCLILQYDRRLVSRRESVYIRRYTHTHIKYLPDSGQHRLRAPRVRLPYMVPAMEQNFTLRPCATDFSVAAILARRDQGAVAAAAAVVVAGKLSATASDAADTQSPTPSPPDQDQRQHRHHHHHHHHHRRRHHNNNHQTAAAAAATTSAVTTAAAAYDDEDDDEGENGRQKFNIIFTSKNSSPLGLDVHPAKFITPFPVVSSLTTTECFPPS